MSASDAAPFVSPCDPRSVVNDQRFRALVRERLMLRCGLSAILLIGFFGIVLIASLAPSLFDRHLPGDVPPAIAMTVAMVFLTVMLTGWYVYRSNRQFDSQARAIAELIA